MENRATAIFEELRPFLTGLAYRMLGSVADAEDAVQEAFLRWRGVDVSAVENPRAFLSKTLSRLCLDKLREARRRREVYVGEWLPEPYVNDLSLAAPAPETVADDISYALMMALERLSPLERAAFLLHDIFEMDFAAIAGVLDRNEAACRQLASRARANLRKEKPRFDVAPETNAKITDAFFTAARSGDAQTLQNILAADAVLHSDGGGRARATLNAIFGGDKIARFFEGIARKNAPNSAGWSRRVLINGMPGEVLIAADGVLQTCAIEITGGRITAIYMMRNPDKLRHVAALAPAS